MKHALIIAFACISAFSVAQIQPQDRMSATEASATLLLRANLKGVKRVRLVMYRGTPEALDALRKVQAILSDHGLAVTTTLDEDAIRGTIPTFEFKTVPTRGFNYWRVEFSMSEAAVILRTKMMAYDAVSFSDGFEFAPYRDGEKKKPKLEDVYAFVATWVATNYEEANKP